MQDVKKTFFISILESVSFMLVGIFMLFYKEKTTSVISYAFGAIFGVLGMFALLKYFFRKDESKYSKYGIVYGLIFLVIASIFIFKTDAVVNYLLPYMIGMFIMISALLKVDYIFILKNSNNNNYKVSIVLIIFSFLCGFLLIFNPFEKALDIALMIGLSVIIYSILNIVYTYILRCNLKRNVSEEIVVTKKEE